MPRSRRPTNVRYARVAEAGAIRDLLATAKDQIPFGPQFDPEKLRRQCQQRDWWVVDTDHGIGGALCLWGDEMRYLIVDPMHRREGIASSLLAYAKWRWPTSWAKTKEGNAATIALLKKEGFTRESVKDTEGWLAFARERGRPVMSAYA